MIRQMIKIEEDKCDGCGLCAQACHEGAIAIIEGKAKLIRDDYCDGLGNCLPVCPTGAISFEEREAAEFDKDAVVENQIKAQPEQIQTSFSGCPGSRSMSFERKAEAPAEISPSFEMESQLRQWPVQIKLVPINAPYFENANLLIAADCAAFAYGDFHNKFMKNHIALIGCPKLDEGDYSEKLSAIIKNNNIKSVKVVRMEV
ncbi:MAG: 4Fe-4S binding protein, partial [Peptostreptococcaceae bacterium]|nr:4Fe-4S binding protein [Peptostreptococcaceae bacterium]